jgi:putative transcriptional regulator
MPIVVNLDVMLAKRKRRLNELSDYVGVSAQNLSILKTGKARAVRFSTLAAICEFLECQPGDILEWRPEAAAASKAGEGETSVPMEEKKTDEVAAMAPIDDKLWKSLTRTPWKR